MRRRRCTLAGFSALAAGLLLGVGSALAQEPDIPAAPPGPQPHEMMRELRQVQDRVARGDMEAVIRQRTLVDKLATAFEKFDDAVWKEPRNGRAVLALVLSGADPKVLRTLLLRGQPSSIDVNLARGVHAFKSNRKGEALDHFAAIDALGLEPTLGGPVALAQAEYAARSDLKKALAKLAEARLLAPGTLIEEASLRRQVAILSTMKQFDEADRVSEIYLRRFASSAYAGTLKRQIARYAVERPAIDAKAPATLLETAINRMGPRDKLEMYLEIAREAVSRARRDIIEFAGTHANTLSEDGSPARIRAQIYLQSMKVASLDADKAKAALEGLKSDTLNKEEVELIQAAQAIAGEVNRVVTVTPSDKPEPEWLNELGATFTNVGRARENLALADRLLTEASK